MKKMTESSIQSAFAGECVAHMKYLNYAEQAEKEGYLNIAQLFRAAAFSEQVHASNHLRALGGVLDTCANVEAALEGENAEIQEIYPMYRVVAQAQDESRAMRVINWALETEKVHARLYGEAKQAIEVGTDMAAMEIKVCRTCGFTMEGDPPDVCSMCRAKRDSFCEF